MRPDEIADTEIYPAGLQHATPTEKACFKLGFVRGYYFAAMLWRSLCLLILLAVFIVAVVAHGL